MAIPQMILLLGSLAAGGATFPVSGGSGAATRIQAAVDACPADGCTIEFPDASYYMDAPVWVRNRSGIGFVGTGANVPVFRFVTAR